MLSDNITTKIKELALDVVQSIEEEDLLGLTFFIGQARCLH